MYREASIRLVLSIGRWVPSESGWGAAGSLALARRSEDKELLEAGEEALGLSEGG